MKHTLQIYHHNIYLFEFNEKYCDRFTDTLLH